MSWTAAVLHALCEPDPAAKCEATAALAPPSQGDLAWNAAADVAAIPGRPERPRRVDPRAVPRRGFGSVEGRAALLHAVAHIEFNAINLALDACWRFRDMPLEYYGDWISVARDEARHFRMLAERLGGLGYGYGDFDAHDGLWEAARKTSSDVLERMALVPRVLEARGLDVTPGLIAKLRQAGDAASAGILEVILEEEVRHVAIGNRWFTSLCARRGCDPEETFLALARREGMLPQPPFNSRARRDAGFTQSELDSLSSMRR